MRCAADLPEVQAGLLAGSGNADHADASSDAGNAAGIAGDLALDGEAEPEHPLHGSQAGMLAEGNGETAPVSAGLEEGIAAGTASDMAQHAEALPVQLPQSRQAEPGPIVEANAAGTATDMTLPPQAQHPTHSSQVCRVAEPLGAVPVTYQMQTFMC